MHVNIEQFKKKTVGMAIASISAAGLNYLLNMIFIPKFGYIAAAYTTLASFLWLMIIHMFLVYKIGYANIYDQTKFLKMVVCMGLYTVAVHFLYGNTILRYLILSAYGGMFVYLFFININNRETVLNFISQKKL